MYGVTFVRCVWKRKHWTRLGIAFSCLWLPIVCGKYRQANEIPAIIKFIVFKMSTSILNNIIQMISISNKSLVFFQIFNTAYFYCSRYWNFSVLCVLGARRWEVSVHIWYTKVLLYLCTIDVKGYEMPNLFYEMDTDVLLHCCASTVQSDTSVK